MHPHQVFYSLTFFRDFLDVTFAVDFLDVTFAVGFLDVTFAGLPPKHGLNLDVTFAVFSV